MINFFIRYKVLAGSAFVVVLIGAGVLLFENNSSGASSESADAPTNALDREYWEYLRLRDPATGRIPDNIRNLELAYSQKIPGSPTRLNSKNDSPLGLTWVGRGPFNVGGRTRGLAIDVSDETVIIAGGVSGGMWRSDDAGQTWTLTTEKDQIHSVSCLAQDTRPGKTDVWYYGTGELWGNSEDIRGDGIFKSIDGGRSWFLLESTSVNQPQLWNSPFNFVWRIAPDPSVTDKDVVYAATAVGGIYKSDDGGDTWRPVLGDFGNQYPFFTDIMITPSGVKYATMSEFTFESYRPAVERGIYRSLDGETWTEITPDDFPPVFKRIVLACAPSDEDQVYFLAETPGYGQLTTNTRGDDLWDSFWKYTYVSGDGTGEGGIWEDRSSNIPKPETVRLQFNPQGSYNLVVKVKPDDPETVFIGGTNLYRSSDGFATDNWDMIGGYCPQTPDYECRDIYTFPNHHPDLHQITFLPSNPSVMFTGSDGGVHRTDDCEAEIMEWISLNNGYLTTQFYTCAVNNEIENDEIIGGLQDNGTLFASSSDPFKPWGYPAGADGFFCAISPDGEFHYTSNNTSKQPKIKIWRKKLDDNGDPIVSTRIDPIGGEDFIWNTPFLLDPNDKNRMWLAGGKFVWRNNDLSKIPIEETTDSTDIEWDKLTKTDTGEESITAISCSKNPANVVYYGTSYGKIFRIDDAHVGDPEPVDVSSQQFTTKYVSCIAIDPDDASEAFAVFNNYNAISIFHTTDAGETWTPVAGNLEEFPNGGGSGPACYWLEIVPVGERKMYFVATTTGVYSTAFINGSGTAWRLEAGDVIGNVVVNMLDSRYSDGFLACGTHGRGMFSTYVDRLPDLPGKTTLSSPEDEHGGFSESVLLEWFPVPDAGSYKVQIARDEDFEDVIFEEVVVSDTMLLFDDIEQGQKPHYWRVAAMSSAGIGEFSDSRAFISSPEAPELIAPENGADEMPSTIEFSWSPAEGADSYRFQISEHLLFAEFLLDSSGVVGNSILIDNLKGSEKYYWRVASEDSWGAGLPSDRRFLKTGEVNSVVEGGSDNDVNIFPNPAENDVEIEFPSNVSSIATIEIFDAGGSILQTIETTATIGNNSVKINCASLPSGKYYFRVTVGNRTFAGSFVKA